MFIDTVAIVSRIWVHKHRQSCTGIANAWSFAYPQRNKSSGMMSGERGGQQVGPPHPIQWSRKDSVREFRTSRLQCGGAPSCWKITWDCSSATWGYKNCSSMSWYTRPVIDFSWMKKGPIILLFIRLHQTFTFGLSRMCEFCIPQILTLCWLTDPDAWNAASSENEKFPRNWGSLSIRSNISIVNACRRGLASGFNCWTMCTL